MSLHAMPSAVPYLLHPESSSFHPTPLCKHFSHGINSFLAVFSFSIFSSRPCLSEIIFFAPSAAGLYN